MAQGVAQIFDGITAQQYTALCAKARDAGIAITGDAGTASKCGVEVNWKYEAESKRLTIQVMRVPFFVSRENVETKIHALVTETIGVV
jgi:hypothetical protein